MLERLIHDFRYGFRQLTTRPNSSIAVIITLALGVGANTCIFSALNGYLIKPLPYPSSDKLIRIFQAQDKIGLGALGPFSPLNYLTIKRQTTAFSAIGAYSTTLYNLSVKGRTERVKALATTASSFNVLGVPPLVGQVFDQRQQQRGANRVIVLSYALWQKVFGSNVKVIGQRVRLDGTPYTVIGVMPQNFTFPDLDTVGLWVPLVFSKGDLTESNRLSNYIEVIGRLKPRATLATANIELNSMLGRVIQQYPEVQQAAEKTGYRWAAEPYQKFLTIREKPLLLLLQGAALFILLIACVNVANLLLARVIARYHELAIRATIGARLTMLARQLLIEAICFTVPAGVLGVSAGLWGLALLRSYGLAGDESPFDIAPDWHVALFALLVIILTAAVVSLGPILRLSRLDPQAVMQEVLPSASGGRRAKVTRWILAVIELSLTTALFASAALLLHSFINLQQTGMGFNPENLLSAEIVVPSQGEHKSDRLRAFYATVMERVDALPGVKRAALAYYTPLDYEMDGEYAVPGDGGQPVPAHAWVDYVDGNFFRTLGVPFLRGTMFASELASHNERTAVIDQRAASKSFPNADPVGKYISYDGEKYRITGVVPDIKSSYMPRPEFGTVYLNIDQQPTSYPHLLIKTQIAPYTLVTQIKQIVEQIDPSVSVSNFRTLKDLKASQLEGRSATAIFVLSFGLLALVLAMIGIYSVLSYSVNQRTSEFGIRLALGAKSSEIFSLVLKEGASLLAIGLAVGVACATTLGIAFSSLAFQIKPLDPVALVIAVFFVSMTTLAACYLPAKKAAKLDPATALKHE